MSNVISYALYHNEDPVAFRSYLRGLHLNIRMAEVIYPGWQVRVHVDERTAEHPYIQQLPNVQVFPAAAPCEMMLWRMRPAFDKTVQRFICRDTDSLLCLKEKLCVDYWMNGPKCALGINDSVSHTIPLMGGMIGFIAGSFRDRLCVPDFASLLQLQPMSLECKGSDQDFLNQVVLPRVSDSITEFCFLGRPDSFRGDWHNRFSDDTFIDPELVETNYLAFHIGAAGMRVDHAIEWLNKRQGDKYDEVESKFKDVFYWKL